MCYNISMQNKSITGQTAHLRLRDFSIINEQKKMYRDFQSSDFINYARAKHKIYKINTNIE